MLMNWSMAEKEYKDCVHWPPFPESTSLGPIIVLHQKPAPQAKAPRQAKRPLSKNNWGYVSV